MCECAEGADEEHFDEGHGAGHALLETEQVQLGLAEVSLGSDLYQFKKHIEAEAWTYVSFEKVDADVYALDHVQKVSL